MNKLNSMRFLEKNNILYEVVEFPDSMRDAEEIAEVLGVPPHLVFKTLVVEPVEAGKPFLVMIPAHRSLDLKRMAQASGHKKVRMASHADAENLTGLKVGGISALALTHKNWDVYLDQSATSLEHIMISAGQRGLDLRVPTASIIRVLRAKIVDVSIEQGDE
jgi:Cys-tRNA(Pro)/Cys-tRNA(Cys) deacylase